MATMMHRPTICLILAMLAAAVKCSFHLFHITPDELTTKLEEKPLKTDEVFNLFDKVGGKKSQVFIGNTNLRKLINLNKIDTFSCIGDTFKERIAVCQDAKAAKISNVDSYCQDRLAKLALRCLVDSKLLVKSVLFHEDMNMLDFLRSLMAGHLDDEPDKYESILEEFLGANWREDSDKNSHKDSERIEKVEHLEEYCNQFILDMQEQAQVFELSKKYSNDQSAKMSQNAERWMRAYDLCKFFLKIYKDKITEHQETVSTSGV